MIIVCKSCNGSPEKVLRTELSLSWEGTCRRPKVLMVKAYGNVPGAKISL